MKKKIYGITMAIALLAPIGVLTAGPAGAAAGTTCKTTVGAATITPGLAVKPVKQTISATSTIGGCTGGGVKSGSSKAVNITPNGTCAGLAQKGVKSSITETITWNTKVTSTLTGSTVTGPKVGQATITLKVTKGLFVGLHGSQIIAFTPKAGQKCTAASPLKNLTIKAVTSFVIKP